MCESIRHSRAATLGAAKSAIFTQASLATLDELFDLIDSDRSGSIDASELENAFRCARLAGGVDVYIGMALAAAPYHSEFMANLAAGPTPSELGKAEFKEKLLYGWRK